MPPAIVQERPARLDCDVLVLGAGLAGMRAAWAAKEADPRLSVFLVSPRARASGSSFANRNNALGMQAPAAHEAEAFVAETLRLAPPGEILPGLVQALAQDAPARLADLLDLGLAFRRGPDGSLARFPGCFSAAPRAVVFDGLASAHAAFLARVGGLGVTLLCGYEALDLLQRGGRVCGARLAALRGGGGLRVDARAVVAALGGPAPLFARRISGPGGSGLGLGLLARAGARLVNARFVQFFWVRASDYCFVNPGDLPWPESLSALAAMRRGHCPLSHALPDAALDRALLAGREASGLVRVPGCEPLVLAAHAGNGGARIDTAGRTSVPGLHACGECAGGMHGADRLGGAMVLSALAFGARAGAAAALEAGSLRPGAAPFDGDFSAAERHPGDAAFLRRLRRGMDHNALPGQPAAPRFLDWLGRAARHDASLRQQLLAASALAVLGEG